MKEKAINSMVVIIDKNGQFHYMGEVNDGVLHNSYLLEYITQNYSNEKEFAEVNENTYNKITVYHLLNMGDIVYLNGGYFGNVFLPENMSEAQIKAVYEMALDLGEQPILLNYNPTTDLGFLNYQAIGINEDMNLKEVIDEYMSEFEKQGLHLNR